GGWGRWAGGAWRGATVETRNPYRGRLPWTGADADDFFGRDVLVDSLVARMAEPVEGSRFLAVVGPSGSGKSSAVRAGLVPTLRRGALPGSDHWFYVEMLPGAHPLEELEAALLRIAVNPPSSLMELLEREEEGLARAIGGPADRVGVVPELALVAEMVADVSDRPGGLPLLQYALTELFDRRRDGAMTLEAYREIDGISGALARRAEELFEGLGKPEREAAKQLFLRLVTAGEGVP